MRRVVSPMMAPSSCAPTTWTPCSPTFPGSSNAQPGIRSLQSSDADLGWYSTSSCNDPAYLIMLFLRQTLLLAAHHSKQLLRSRRMLLCLVLVILVGLLYTLAARHSAPMRAFTPISIVLVLPVLAPLVGLILGTSVMAEEVESKTLTYLFTRPLHRGSLFLGRWFACAWIAGLLLGGLAAYIGFEAESMNAVATKNPAPPGLALRFMAVAATGAILFTAIAATLSALLRRPIIYGLGYAFVLEGLIGNLPGSTQRFSLQFYLRSALIDTDGEAFQRMRFLQELGLIEAGPAFLRLGMALAVLLGIGLLVVRRKQYLLSS
ncbi:MAG: ABC transporter permease subunit [Planctomycetota bacterium]